MNIRSFVSNVGLGLAAVTLSTSAFAQVCDNGRLVILPEVEASFGPFSGVYGPGDNPALLLPKFDASNFALPRGAVLVGVEFSAYVGLESSGGVGNQGDAPCSGVWGGEVTGTLFNDPTLPALSPYLECTKTAQRLENFTLNPGASIDYPLESTIGHCPTVNPGNTQQSVTLTDPGDLAAFMGPGSLVFDHAAAVSTATASSCGMLQSLTDLAAFMVVSVQYTYCVEEEPPVGGEGCTPGFWKNWLSQWAATGFDPGDSWVAVFGVDPFPPRLTLLDALNQGGGGWNRLGRHSTAALLNAASPNVDYPFTVAEVIDLVQQAWITGDTHAVADVLEAANELGCPDPR